jgi:hypothetical protein
MRESERKSGHNDRFSSTLKVLQEIHEELGRTKRTRTSQNRTHGNNGRIVGHAVDFDTSNMLRAQKKQVQNNRKRRSNNDRIQLNKLQPQRHSAHSQSTRTLKLAPNIQNIQIRNHRSANASHQMPNFPAPKPSVYDIKHDNFQMNKHNTIRRHQNQVNQAVGQRRIVVGNFKGATRTNSQTVQSTLHQQIAETAALVQRLDNQYDYVSNSVNRYRKEQKRIKNAKK